ncbi:hypothetical protein OAH45_05690 [Candidatus Pelagibacter sp.]|nr:hypothetical protein [Candidatus Pelagibacter sp.]MDC0465988.1 hypothetical protein [Candidatus Pelagibacter sp.]
MRLYEKIRKKTICFIPIKENSQRLKFKNFRKIGNKPLFKHTIDKVIKIKDFDKVIVDTDSKKIQDYCKLNNIKFIKRLDYLKSKKSNGNDLLKYWIQIEPNYEYYFQLHVTSPFVKRDSIRKCIKEIQTNKKINSIFTATKEHSWYWYNKKPINFKKYKLTRSQELKPIIRDITFLYGISKIEFLKNNSRIGSKPYPFIVSQKESVDINESFDLEFARNMFKIYT